MTRVTNFGRKRTYVEAGFARDPPAVLEPQTLPVEQVKNAAIQKETCETLVAVPPPKKKRKRTPKSKRDGNPNKETKPEDTTTATEGSFRAPEHQSVVEGAQIQQKLPTVAKQAKKKREKRKPRLSPSELRRQKRNAEKLAQTTCFGCREKGHAAKDCPVTNAVSEEGSNKAMAKGIAIICYRCGSTKHTLSRCKATVNQENPLPFASCFVCSEKGHLASGCPKNKGKGIYPDGGCCKLCGDNTHLAKNCGLRKRDVVSTTEVLGTGQEAGPDEDDFHIFKRRTTEVEWDEKEEDKTKRSMGIKTGIHSGVVKAFGSAAVAPKKKVIFF